jgi:VanZ family protein|uniref:VanZ-like domain-containing protein n=1 Tax=Desulfobacca acetoxidans TaxID=60893 RepID=A0A7C5EKV3_9BACT
MKPPTPGEFSPAHPSWRYWVPPVLMSLAILAVSGDLGASPNTLGILVWLFSDFLAFSSEALDLLHGILRKAGHFMAYGICAFLWFRAFAFYHPRRLAANAALALGVSLLLALLDEGHQFWVSSRSGSLGDVALDMAGAAFLVLLATLRKKQVPKQTGGSCSSPS